MQVGASEVKVHEYDTDKYAKCKTFIYSLDAHPNTDFNERFTVAGGSTTSIRMEETKSMAWSTEFSKSTNCYPQSVPFLFELDSDKDKPVIARKMFFHHQTYTPA